MKYLIFILLLLPIFSLSAQTQNDLIGNWKVVKADIPLENIAPDQQGLLDMLKSEFLTSLFSFKENNHFTYKISIEELNIKDGFWSLGPDKKTINIKSWANKDKEGHFLMGFDITKFERSKMTLFMSDSGMVMELELERVN